MKRIIAAIIILLAFLNIHGQEQCAFILEEAQDMFDAGQIETIPEKLAGCLESGFSRDEKLQAYKLIIFSYLYDDNIVEADAMMLKFLKDYPSYEVVATDPMNFVALKETYDTRPILMLGGGMGANMTLPLSLVNLGPSNYEKFPGNYVPGSASFNASVIARKRINDHFLISGEVSYFTVKFDYYLDTRENTDPFSAEITDFSLIEYYETQNKLMLPIGAVYQFSNSDFSPYITAGICPGVLLKSVGEGFRDYVDLGITRVEVAPTTVTDARRIFSMYGFLGGGIKYSLGPGEAFLDARFFANPLTQVKPGSDRFIPELTYELLYTDDELLLNSISISAGYMLPIYNPKKKVD